MGTNIRSAADVFNQYFTERNRIRMGRFFFDLALVVELVLMIIEKSELTFSMESHVFRITFLVTLLAVLVRQHSKKEWFIILAVWVFTFICYRISGRNELLRFATFAMAARDIDLKKAIRFSFDVSLAGFSIIALLSLTGLLGSVSNVMDYGRESTTELRYVLGFGHPNTLYGCAFALMLMWLWIYGREAHLWQYITLLAVNVVLYFLTLSRTGLMIGVMTMVLALAVRYIKPLKNFVFPYILAILVTPIACAGFSTWASTAGHIPRYIWDTKYDFFVWRLDEFLNNRIQYLYRANEKHAGSLFTWKLFSDRESFEYFDMGWVRLFYWYGIIPAILVCILIAVFIYVCGRKKDLMTVALLVSLSVYTVIEATFVSVYIGRNFFLPIFGVYMWALIRGDLSKNTTLP